MTRWRKTVAALTAVLVIASLSAGAQADAEPEAPAEESEALGITLTVQNEAYREDLAATSTMVRVYQVATGDEYGQYTLSAGFEALESEEQWNGGALTGETELEALRTAAMGVLGLEDPAVPESPESTPEPEAAEPPAEVPAVTAIYEGELALVDGKVSIPARGLYLVVPESPVQTDLWQYTFGPILLPVPAVEAGAWQYDVTAQMKPTQERRLVSLEIVKNLLTYNSNLGPATFVFDVVGRLDGAVVYQSTERLTFDDAAGAQQRVRIENIPAGAEVTVTEVYTGASYANTDGTVKVVVVDPGTLPEGQDVHRVEFTNDYTGSRIPNVAVENVFTMVGEGWQWHSERGSEEAG